jgi:hypothetical protein
MHLLRAAIAIPIITIDLAIFQIELPYSDSPSATARTSAITCARSGLGPLRGLNSVGSARRRACPALRGRQGLALGAPHADKPQRTRKHCHLWPKTGRKAVFFMSIRTAAKPEWTLASVALKARSAQRDLMPLTTEPKGCGGKIPSARARFAHSICGSDGEAWSLNSLLKSRITEFGARIRLMAAIWAIQHGMKREN